MRPDYLLLLMGGAISRQQSRWDKGAEVQLPYPQYFGQNISENFAFKGPYPTTCPLRFSDLPTALSSTSQIESAFFGIKQYIIQTITCVHKQSP